MKLEELMRINNRISNQTFARYWKHYNYPEEEPWLMAIAVVNSSPGLEKELQGLGFYLAKREYSFVHQSSISYYAIARTF